MIPSGILAKEARAVEEAALEEAKKLGGAALTAIEGAIETQLGGPITPGPITAVPTSGPVTVALSDAQFAQLVTLLTPGYECAQLMLQQYPAQAAAAKAAEPKAPDTVAGAGGAGTDTVTGGA